MWDQTQYTMFKWIHFEIHTLMAYNDEIMFENSLMLGQAGMTLWNLLSSALSGCHGYLLHFVY